MTDDRTINFICKMAPALEESVPNDLRYEIELAIMALKGLKNTPYDRKRVFHAIWNVLAKYRTKEVEIITALACPKRCDPDDNDDCTACGGLGLVPKEPHGPA